MPEPKAPAHVVELARERSRARGARDWARADELRAAIESAGWRIVDAGTDFTLTPARPPDLVAEGRTWYGSPEHVPSRAAEPATARATIVVIATDRERSPDEALEALARQRYPGVETLVVAPRGLPLTGPSDDLLGTVAPFGAGDALAAALRRAGGSAVIVLAPDRLVEGDVPGIVETALVDPTVAIVGAEGLDSRDLRRYQPAGPGDVTAVRSGCYAFRRADALAIGRLDGQLNLPDSVAAWLSLALRDRGPEEPPRRALALKLPVSWADASALGHSADPSPGLPADHARLARRDAYRIAARFGRHRWLAAASADERVERVPGEGAQGHDEGDDGHEREDAAQAQDTRDAVGLLDDRPAKERASDPAR